MAKRDADPSPRGMALSARFALTMSVALIAVMAVAGYFLHRTTTGIARQAQTEAVVAATRTHGRGTDRLEQVDSRARLFLGGEVRSFDVVYSDTGDDRERRGQLYQYHDNKAYLVVPDTAGDTQQALLQLVGAITAGVILVGAVVAFIVGNQVSSPLGQLVEDVRQIARGDLRHRTRGRGIGELGHLSRAIDRMTQNLLEAQEAQVELSVRDREFEVAGEVREALLPQSTPLIEGYDLGAMHVASSTPGGDFHDYIELGDGRVGLLVCEVSGHGIPGALVGATARSYLRAELARGGDLAETLWKVNRQLALDMRRGMYVTALYVLVDPAEHSATVACAGHKIPLIRFSSEDQKIRLLQPEGIALGFDKGAVFERALTLQTLPLHVGDRLVLANSGPVRVQNPAGEELGEKEFYRLVLRWAGLDTPKLLKRLKNAFGEYADEEPFPYDISILTVAREA